jgi:hypothetical protein
MYVGSNFFLLLWIFDVIVWNQRPGTGGMASNESEVIPVISEIL